MPTLCKDPSLAANYHPVSLLSVCYKLLERLALQRISPTVEGLFSPDQAGFRKGRSTCDQVAALTTLIENGFQQNLKMAPSFWTWQQHMTLSGTLVFFTNWVKACHIGSPDWWVCCFETWNWNAVSRRIWRGCHTSVDSGDLNQAPTK